MSSTKRETPPMDSKIEPVAWTSHANLKVAEQDEPFYAAVMGPKNTPEMNVALYTGEQMTAALLAAEQRGRDKERERCARLAYSICAETRHVTLGDKTAAAIRKG